MILQPVGEGQVREFELWDSQTTQRVNGHFFIAAAEYLPDLGGWISQCPACHCLRCLKIDIQNETWQCLECTKKGTFKKPEEKKRDPNRKKVRKELAGRKKKE